MVLTGESTLGRNAKKPFEGWRGANVFFVEIHFLLRCYHLKIFAKLVQVFKIFTAVLSLVILHSYFPEL